MKKISPFLLYPLLGLIGIFSGCSDNDFPEYAELEDLEISLDRPEYTCAIGDMLSIEPKISGDIPDSDLLFYWEVGHGEGYGDRTKFSAIAETRNLNMQCELGPLFPSPSTYTLRIRAKQVSNGRDFYSKHFRLKITGKTGLMALYGDNGKSDIALIRDFTDRNGIVLEHFYSEANGGMKIPGTGRFLTQLQGGEVSFANYHSIIAVTDQSSIGADYLTMNEIAGGWDNLLFKGGFNRGCPENIVYSSRNPMEQFQEVYIIDGGEIYGRQNSEFVLRPAIGTSSNSYINSYDIAPFAYTAPGGNYQVWLFDKNSRAFIGVTNTIAVFMNGAAHAGSVAKVFTPGGAFNPSRMRADLIYMAEGGEKKHLLAVMQRDNGELFIAELNTVPLDPSETAQAIHELDTSGLDEIIGYDFRSHSPSRDCCYLYTRKDVYRMNIDGKGTSVTPRKIEWPENDAPSDRGDITTMLTLNHNGTEVMAIARWDGSNGAISCYSIDTQSGNPAELLSTYSVAGKIEALHIKHI